MRYYTFLALLWAVLACQTQPAEPDSPRPPAGLAPASVPAITPALSPENASPPHDSAYAILPGRHAGPITNSTTLAELEELFGAENLTLTRSDLDGGVVVETRAVFAGTPDELTVFLPELNDHDYLGGAYVRLDSTGGRWHLSGSGLRPGTDLAEVERLNGRPFSLLGSSSEGAGQVTDWRGGRLTGSDYVTFGGLHRVPGAEGNGEMEVSSNDLLLKATNLEVTSIFVPLH